MKRSNPKYFWVQVFDLGENLVKQYKIFVSPQAAQDKAEYEAKQPDVDVVYILSGNAKPANLDEVPSLNNPILPKVEEILNRVEPRPFKESGKRSVPVSTLALVREQTITGNLVRKELVKTKAWASKL